jgi:hypothetical protein
MDNKNYKFDVDFTLWDRLTLPYWRLVGKLEMWMMEVKWAYQRVVRGYDDTAIWNFEEYVAQQIKEVCFRIAEDGHGYPNHLTEKKWKQILLDISFGFGSYIEMRSGIYEVKSKEFKSLQKDYKKGLKLFVDNHEYLWD